MQTNTIYTGDSLKVLKSFPDRSVHCIATSPPYWGHRDYNVKGQYGLEKSHKAFIRKLVVLFRECRRVLRDDGTLWVNIGDTYATRGGGPGNSFTAASNDKKKAATNLSGKRKPSGTIKAKDLVGIPWMLAFALRADGWYLRQDIIWHKPNPMPESVTDRCTKSHEYIFLFSKSAKYYYDHNAIKQPMRDSSLERLSQDIGGQRGSDRVPGKTNGAMKAVGMYVGGKKHKNLDYNGQSNHSFHRTRNENGQEWQSVDGMANKRSVWTVATTPFKEAHFATFPEELIVDCIKAGCPEGGIVLDIFMGAGTTALVAAKNNRQYVGIELNPAYVAIAEKRLQQELGMFYKVCS